VGKVFGGVDCLWIQQKHLIIGGVLTSVETAFRDHK
jgi:hypothetical protein